MMAAPGAQLKREEKEQTEFVILEDVPADKKIATKVVRTYWSGFKRTKT